MQRTWAEIDLKLLQCNLAEVRNVIGPKVRLLGIVKADAYGLGAVEITRALVSQGVDYLGVAWIAEARQLREAAITTPILVLSEPLPALAEETIQLDLTQSVYSFDFVDHLEQAAEYLGKKVKVHIKVDTGMNRVGIDPDHTVDLAKHIQHKKHVFLEGVFTHFATSDEATSSYFAFQKGRFQSVLADLKEAGIAIPIIHAANSAATLNSPDTHFDMVRVGIHLYHNLLQFKTRVNMVKEVNLGQKISYGGIFQTQRPTRIATLSVGYADGYDRLLSNRGRVIIDGQFYPVVGRVTMDMTMIDIGHNEQIKAGDEAVIIGRQGTKEIRVEDLAREAGTLNYEILTGIGKRVARIYLNT